MASLVQAHRRESLLKLSLFLENLLFKVPLILSKDNGDRHSVWDLRLDELRQLGEGFLPAEVAHLGMNDGGHASLLNV